MSNHKPDLNSGRCYEYNGFGGGGEGKLEKQGNAKITEIWECKQTLQFFHATGKEAGE